MRKKKNGILEIIYNLFSCWMTPITQSNQTCIKTCISSDTSRRTLIESRNRVCLLIFQTWERRRMGYWKLFRIYLAVGWITRVDNRVSWYIISDSLCRHRNSILFESNRPVFRKWMRGQWGRERVLLWISRHPGWRDLPATTSTVNLPGGTMVFNGTRMERNVAYWAKLIFQ